MYKLHVLNGDVHIRNSPFTHQVRPGMINPANCKVDGLFGHIPQSGAVNHFVIVTCDQFNNQQIVGGENFFVSIVGGNNPVPLVTGISYL